MAVVYRPLNSDTREIRLISVKGSSNDEELLRCSWRYTSLYRPHQADYEAISYHWGDLSYTRSVILDGQVVEVPANAERALRRMIQGCGNGRLLWIDALCIHQSSSEEKSQQVAMMDQIFSKAQRVLVYLGAEDQWFGAGIRCVRAIWDRVYSSGYWQNSDIEPFDHADMQDIVDLEGLGGVHTMPWFRRTWTVQEFVLARECVCVLADKSAVDMELLLRIGTRPYTTKYISRMSNFLRCNSGLARAQARLWLQASQSSKESCHLLDALRFSRKFACSDARDKIFGMFAILRRLGEGSRLPLTTRNYCKSIAEVVRDATRFAWETPLRPIVNLEAIQHRREAHIEASDVPTWVYRFDRKTRAYSDDPNSIITKYGIGYPLSTPAYASGKHLDDDPNILNLQGLYLDRVELLSGVLRAFTANDMANT